MTHSTSRISRSLLCLASCAALFASAGAHAAGDQINAERPSFVDSTSVVGVKGFQIETGVAGERNFSRGVRTEDYSTPTLLRIGVAKDVEVRFGTEGFQSKHSYNTLSGASNTVQGFGGSSVGLKYRAAEQKGNLPSIAFIGQLDLESGADRLQRDGLRPSLRMAAEWALPRNMILGVMPGIATERNAFGERVTTGSMGVVLGKQWTSKVSSFVEVAAPRLAHTVDGGNLVTFDIGGAYLLSKNSQIDAAFKRGLNSNTPDYAWTIGYSVKM